MDGSCLRTMSTIRPGDVREENRMWRGAMSAAACTNTARTTASEASSDGLMDASATAVAGVLMNGLIFLLFLLVVVEEDDDELVLVFLRLLVLLLLLLLLDGKNEDVRFDFFCCCCCCLSCSFCCFAAFAANAFRNGLLLLLSFAALAVKVDPPAGALA